MDKYKARLVAKGYKQHYMNDYTKVFSPVARHDSIRLVVALAAHAKSFPIFQLDIKWTFLHGYLEEHVFIDQPPNYVKVGYENKVYRLKCLAIIKALSICLVRKSKTCVRGL